MLFCSHDIFQIFNDNLDEKTQLSRIEVKRGNTFLGIGDNWHLEKVIDILK